MKRDLFYLIAGALCVLYGMVVMLANSGTRFFMIWYLAGVFFGGLYVLEQSGLWKHCPAGIRTFLMVLVILGILLFLVVEGLVLSCFGKQGEKNLDVLVVLGAQVHSHGPSLSLKYRLDAAYDYLVENEKTICIVSGGKGSNEPDSEAHVMKEYLTGRGIDPARILMEDQSVNTMENMKFSSRLFDPEKDQAAIVTNDFHMFRALHLARKQGYRRLYAISARSNPVYLLNNMVREFFGIGKDFLAGHLA